ncbi:MAG: hypothetical protein EOP04_30575, partial [Proteobacteria bacterium]
RRQRRPRHRPAAGRQGHRLAGASAHGGAAGEHRPHRPRGRRAGLPDLLRLRDQGADPVRCKAAEIDQPGQTLTNEKNISFILMELAPYGDFFDMIMTHQIPFNEKLARTYFHQLIKGLEYLHFQGVAHLDIKLENLLVGQDFQLKVADFDNACINGQSFTNARGTAFYRAPELINGTCQDGFAADIYSAAIILFLFKSGGVLPHSENKIFRGMNLFDMMNRDNRNFWQKHAEIQNKQVEYFDEDFKALFNSMTRFHPSERISLEEIKKSNWYNGPVFTDQELAFVMNQLYPNA